MSQCFKCNSQAEEKSVKVTCKGCKRLICNKCSGLTATELRVFGLQTQKLSYLCDDCEAGLRQVPELRRLVTELQQQVEEMKSSQSNVVNLDAVIDEIEERKKRSRNVIVYGIPESNATSPEERKTHDKTTVAQAFTSLPVSDLEIVTIFRLGKPNLNDNSKPRPVKVVLGNKRSATSILKNKSKLSKTIRIYSDMTPYQRDQLKKLREELTLRTDKVRPDDDLPEPTVRIMARSTVYNVGETKAIFCKGQNLVEPIQWYSPSGKLVEERSTKNSRVYVERKTENDGVLVPLIIHRIKITDGGNWTCKSGNLSETREFIVGEKVNITDRNVTMEGEEGKSVKLTCEANGYPPPVVVWYKDKQQIRDKDEPKKYTIKQDNTLEIKKLNHADVGLYVCKVRQKALSHYTEKTVHLSVQHKPILYNSDTQMIYTNQKYKTEEVYAILNDTKNVTCSAIANPPPTYRWYRRQNGFDDDPITDPDTVITSEDGTNSVLILRIRDESYYGEYRCSANNSKGTESIIFHVNPGSKPDPPDSVALAVANVTELTFNVSCSSCIFATGDEVSPNPKNLTVLGYVFQLAPAKEGYPADWDGAPEFRVDVEEANNTLFTVGPLGNSTLYHVRVRTRNAAGNSEWLEIADAKTTDDAIRLTATLFLVIATMIIHLYK